MFRKIAISFLIVLVACVGCIGGEPEVTAEVRASATPRSVTHIAQPPNARTPTPTPISPTHPLATATAELLPLVSITADNASAMEPLAQIKMPSQSEIKALDIDTTEQRLAVVNAEGTISIWQFSDSRGRSIKTSQIDVRLVETNRRINDLEFSPDSSELALAGRNAGVIFLDASSGERISALPVNFEASRITYLDGGERIAVAGYSFEDRDPILEIWGVRDGQWKAELADHPTLDQICSLAVSPDGGVLAAGYCDYNMMTWRTSPGFTSLGRVLGIHSWECYGHCGFPNNIVKFVPESHTLVSATDNWEIPFRDIHSGRLVNVISTVRMIDEHSFSAWDAQDIAFSGDGSLFAIVGANELQIRDPNSGEFHHHFQIPIDDYFTHVAFGQSYVLAVAKSEGTVELWGVGG